MRVVRVRGRRDGGGKEKGREERMEVGGMGILASEE